MWELQKIFLLVRSFNQISCNKGLKAKISSFFSCFFFLTLLRLECSRISKTVCSWCHIGWGNTKICIQGASKMEWKHGKCWKLPIFEGKLWVFFSYLSEMKTVSVFYNSSILVLFTACFYRFLFKFKYDKFFVRHSASISRFEWFELLCSTSWYH